MKGTYCQDKYSGGEIMLKESAVATTNPPVAGRREGTDEGVDLPSRGRRAAAGGRRPRAEC